METSIGYLIVNVSTARGAIPLAGASVTVLDEENGGGILTVLATDTAGKTDRIALPAPDRALSDAPGGAKPYALYTLQVEKAGYYPAVFAGVPVFAGVTSIQPAELLGLAEYNADSVYPREGLDFTGQTSPGL